MSLWRINPRQGYEIAKVCFKPLNKPQANLNSSPKYFNYRGSGQVNNVCKHSPVFLLNKKNFWLELEPLSNLSSGNTKKGRLRNPHHYCCLTLQRQFVLSCCRAASCDHPVPCIRVFRNQLGPAQMLRSRYFLVGSGSTLEKSEEIRLFQHCLKFKG